MGFDVTVANIIFFIAFLSAASVALGAYWKSADEIEEARRAEDERADERAHTNLTITSASYNPGLDRFSVDIKNTGTTVVTISQLVYLVDGAIVDQADYFSIGIDGVAGTDLLLPMETLEVVLDDVDPEPEAFQVVAENGARGNWVG